MDTSCMHDSVYDGNCSRPCPSSLDRLVHLVDKAVRRGAWAEMRLDLSFSNRELESQFYEYQSERNRRLETQVGSGQMHSDGPLLRMAVAKPRRRRRVYASGDQQMPWKV